MKGGGGLGGFGGPQRIPERKFLSSNFALSVPAKKKNPEIFDLLILSAGIPRQIPVSPKRPTLTPPPNPTTPNPPEPSPPRTQATRLPPFPSRPSLSSLPFFLVGRAWPGFFFCEDFPNRGCSETLFPKFCFFEVTPFYPENLPPKKNPNL